MFNANAHIQTYKKIGMIALLTSVWGTLKNVVSLKVKNNASKANKAF